MQHTFSVGTKGVDLRLKEAAAASDRAVSKAGGDAIRAMKTVASRKVRERKAIKAGELSTKLRISYPTRTEEKLWRLGIPAQVMPVIMYPARPTKKGVSVLINVGSRVVIPSAFIARMKSGHVGVFRRVGQASRVPTQRYKGHARYAGTKRQAIKELFTTRVIDVFHDAGFVDDVLARGEEVFRGTYTRVLPLELAKRVGA